MSWFGKDIRQLKIVTLASKTRYEKGEYALSFDVLKREDYDKITENRRKEAELYKELDCITGTCSGDIEMELTQKKCLFNFEVSGALKPATELQRGEDALEYNDSLQDNRRHLFLTPTYNKDSGGRAFIKFSHRKTVKHTVSISDVPVTMPSADSSTPSSDVSLASKTTPTCVDGVDSSFYIDAGPSETTLKTATVRASGSPMIPPRNQAEPVPPNSVSGPTSVGCASGDGGEVLDDSKSPYDKILSNSSLQCLADKLSPQDSQKLLIHLKVQPEVIEQEKKNHPGDIVSAMSSCFRCWRGGKKSPSGSNEHTSKELYEELIKQLADVKRNDIKSVIMRVLTANRELSQEDLKQL